MQNSRNVESRKLFIHRKNRVELNLTHNHQELNDILDATRIQCETVSSFARAVNVSRAYWSGNVRAVCAYD